MVLGHGRAQVQYVTIGGTRDGKVTHYQLHVIQDSGGFAEMGTILAPFMTRPMSSAVYDIPNIECRTTSVVTNTTPITAYRGAGRPEATAAAERAMDMFAAEIGMDPVEVRRKNLIAQFLEPHTTVVGQTYDVGDYDGALDKALEAADYADLRKEQAERRAAGGAKQLGIGVSVYVEITGGVPPFGEHATIEVLDDGRAIVYTGTSPHGQGHVTSWSMLAHEQTGIPMDQIDVVWGDTDLVPAGAGTMGSRSLQQGGAAVYQAAGELVDEAKKLAAKLLEADEADVVLDKDKGAFHVAGTPAVAKTWAELAQAAKGEPDLPEGLAQPRSSRPAGRRSRSAPTSPSSRSTPRPARSHLIRHVACDDAGRVLNPLLARGPDPRRRRPGHGAGVARGGPLRQRRQPDHVEPRRLRVHLRRRAAERRGRPHGDADVHEPDSAPRASARAAPSARLRPCSRPWSTRSATSACATSTCRAPPSASGRPSRKRRADACVTEVSRERSVPAPAHRSPQGALAGELALDAVAQLVLLRRGEAGLQDGQDPAFQLDDRRVHVGGDVVEQLGRGARRVGAQPVEQARRRCARGGRGSRRSPRRRRDAPARPSGTGSARSPGGGRRGRRDHLDRRGPLAGRRSAQRRRGAPPACGATSSSGSNAWSAPSWPSASSASSAGSGVCAGRTVDRLRRPGAAPARRRSPVRPPGSSSRRRLAERGHVEHGPAVDDLDQRDDRVHLVVPLRRRRAPSRRAPPARRRPVRSVRRARSGRRR